MLSFYVCCTWSICCLVMSCPMSISLCPSAVCCYCMFSFYVCGTWSICCVTCNVMPHVHFTLSISCLLSCSMLSFYVCGTVCVLHSVHLLCYWYSQLSANRHSRKQTADYIQTLFSFPAITSQSNSVLTHPCKRTQTFLKVELGFFHSLSPKRTPHVLTTVYIY